MYIDKIYIKKKKTKSQKYCYINHNLELIR